MADAILPVLENIVGNIVTTLEGVTTAGSYSQSLEVERPNPALGNRKRDSLAVVVTGSPKRLNDDEGGEAYNLVEWLQPFAIVLTVVESETSEVSPDYRLNIIRSDVEKALLIDPTRGGLAVDTRIGDPEYVDTEKPNASSGELWMVVIVHYRTLYGDPYTQA